MNKIARVIWHKIKLYFIFSRAAFQMYITTQMEQFSRAYISAVVSVAGYGSYVPFPDEDCIDLGVASKVKGTMYSSPRLEIQAKCTAIDDGRGDSLNFELKRKHYDEIRKITQVPRILVAVTTPKNVEDWLTQTDESLTLYKCAYWKSIRGYPERNDIKEDSKVVIPFERTQQFTVQALQDAMKRMADGGLP